MLYGQQLIKQSSTEFFEDNQNMVLGGIKGLGMGMLFGGLKSFDEKDQKLSKKLKNIGMTTAIGAGSGALMGHLLDTNKEQVRKYVHSMEEYLKPQK